MKILKTTTLFFLLFVGVLSVYAQEVWTYDMYETVNEQNFRSNKLFKQNFNSEKPDIALLDAAIFFVTNEQRIKNDLSVMKYHEACEIASYNHSRKMIELDFFSHKNNKESKRYSATDRLELAGVKTGSWGENIAYNSANSSSTYLSIADKFLDQWMHSDGHKKNILNSSNIYFGCGVYCDGYKIYATQVFMRNSNFKKVKTKDKLP